MKQKILHPVHLKATMFLVIYLVLSKVLFIYLVALDELFLPYVIATCFSVFFAILFLYIFSHEDFFKFAKDIELKEKKSEKKWERKFLRYGKMVTVFAVSVVAGPIFAALTIRFLLQSYKHKYELITVATIFSTTLLWFTTKGAVEIFK